MGAYGSPELPPSNNRYEYPSHYQSQYQDPYKPKSEKGGCFKNALMLVGIMALFLFFFYLIGAAMMNSSSASKSGTPANATVYSSPPYSKPPMYSSQSSVSSAPVIVDDSNDFLKSWAKMAVLKALLYPDSAKFSDDPASWKIVRDGNTCEITSMVASRGKNSKQVINGPFVVKITYYDDLNAKVTYISLNGKVWYDSSSTKSK